MIRKHILNESEIFLFIDSIYLNKRLNWYIFSFKNIWSKKTMNQDHKKSVGKNFFNIDPYISHTVLWIRMFTMHKRCRIRAQFNFLRIKSKIF